MQVIPPNERSAGINRRSAPRVTAQCKAIEKALSRYIRLECQHVTSWDVDIVYEVFRPLGPLKHFCENCGQWRKSVKVSHATEYPDEPMF